MVTVLVEYTDSNFSHISNDLNNTFTIPNSSVQGQRLYDAKFKWFNKERLTLNIPTIANSDPYDSGPALSATRFRVANASGVDRNYYYYFVDSVIKNNDGSVVIELSLDYFLTYYLTTFFGSNTSEWFGTNTSIPFMVERSHLMPHPSSYMGAIMGGHYPRMVYGDKYVLLLQTLKRVDFDIAGYINEVIYSNKNFLQVAAGRTKCQIESIAKYTVNSLQFNGYVPGIASENTSGDTGTQGKSSVNIYVNRNIESYTYTFIFNNFIEAFNNTSTGIIMPGPNAANMKVNNFRTSSTTTVSWLNDDLRTMVDSVKGKTFIIPAPVNGDVYKAYASGAFSGTGATLVDIPLPHLVMLMNQCYSVNNSWISGNLYDIGMYGINDYTNSNGANGLILDQTTFLIENLLTKVLGNNTQKTGLPSVETKPNMNKGVTYQDGRDFAVGYTPNVNTTDFFLFKGLNSIYFTFKQGYLCFSFQDYNTFRNGSENIGLMINLIGFNASIVSKGDVYRDADVSLNYGYDNSNTQGLTQANTTLTKGYSQGLSLIPNDAKYAELMNTQYNSLNTSLTNSKMSAMVQGIQGALGMLGGAGNMFYGGYKKYDYMFSLGAYGLAQGAGGLMNAMTTSTNATRSYNSYLKDSVNANSGYVFQNEIPAIPALPTASQIVLNKLGQVRLGNGVNRNGYDINEVFSARHVNLNNLKYDKYLNNNNQIVNLESSSGVYRNKYGFLKFYDFCTENIRQTIISGFQRNNQVLASNHIEGGVQLLVNGFSFNTSD